MGTSGVVLLCPKCVYEVNILFFTRLVSVSYIFDCCTALCFMFSQGVLDLIYSPQGSPLNLFTYTQWACEHLPQQCEYMFYLPLILLNSAMQDINALEENCRLMIACCTTGFSQCLSGIVNASLEFRKSASIKSFTWTGAEILIHTWICVCVCTEGQQEL